MKELYALVNMILAANLTRPTKQSLLGQIQKVTEEVEVDAYRRGRQEGFEAAVDMYNQQL